MSWIRPSLIDEKVRGFFEWKEELHKEDIEEFGHVINRHDYSQLYQMYLDFQTSPEVIEKRKYYYGVSV